MKSMKKNNKEKEKKINKEKKFSIKDLNITDLDKKLANLPYTSDEYQKVLQKIQKKEKACYGADQHILCVSSSKLKALETRTEFLSKGSYASTCEYLELNDFSEFNTISGYHPRYMVEHDYRYKQVLTFGYITNKYRDEFILLRKKDNARLGMIGGHTDFGPAAYGTNAKDFLIQNMYKELFEEVKITDKQNAPINTKELLQSQVTAKMIINENDDPYKLRNIGFIYEIVLDVDNLEHHFNFETNEPNIHTVECVSLKDIVECKRYHSMLKHIPHIIEREEVTPRV
jgi:predicted NUDIX family phosphoesterase